MPSLNDVAQDVARDAITAKWLGTTLVGSAMAVVGGMTTQDWAQVVGMFVGISGLALMAWEKYHTRQERKARMVILRDREKRDRERHKATMAELARGCSVVELPVFDSMGGFND